MPGSEIGYGGDWCRCYEALRERKMFEEQRREMVAAIRAIAEHIAAELGKTALDERASQNMVSSGFCRKLAA